MSKLKKSTLFYYSLTDLPVMMSIFPVIVFVPQFYGGELGVPLATIGTIMFVQRIFDVVTDPLMGFISDRLEEHGVPPLVASYLASLTLFHMPDDTEGAEGEEAAFAEWLDT